jgi:hypothetical protein
MFADEELFKARVVELILKKEVEEALKALSQYYRVNVPGLRVGMPKRFGGNAGCYVSGTKVIHVASMERLYDPFVILHEFYHHLRTQGGKHRGTERHANKFAQEYITAYLNAGRFSFRVSYKQGSENEESEP